MNHDIKPSVLIQRELQNYVYVISVSPAKSRVIICILETLLLQYFDVRVYPIAYFNIQVHKLLFPSVFAWDPLGARPQKYIFVGIRH